MKSRKHKTKKNAAGATGLGSVLGGLLMVVSLATSCSIFDTRPPDEPGESNTCWRVPESPRTVFDNLGCGMVGLTGTEYSKSLYVSFKYIPNARDQVQYPVFASPWNKAKEIIYIDQLISDATSISVEWDPFLEISESTPQSYYRRQYTIVRVRDNAGSPDTSIFRGEAEFYMKEETSGWMIENWVERTSSLNDSFPTAAALRNDYPPF